MPFGEWLRLPHFMMRGLDALRAQRIGIAEGSAFEIGFGAGLSSDHCRAG